MNTQISRGTIAAFALALSALFAAGPVLADKPDWADKGKHRSEKSRHTSDKGDRREYRDERRDDRRDDRRSDSSLTVPRHISGLPLATTRVPEP